MIASLFLTQPSFVLEKETFKKSPSVLSTFTFVPAWSMKSSVESSENPDLTDTVSLIITAEDELYDW